jgi:hypothetical protein
MRSLREGFPWEALESQICIDTMEFFGDPGDGSCILSDLGAAIANLPMPFILELHHKLNACSGLIGFHSVNGGCAPDSRSHSKLFICTRAQ